MQQNTSTIQEIYLFTDLCEYCNKEKATQECSICKKAHCCSNEHYVLYWNFAHRYLCPGVTFKEVEHNPGAAQITEIVIKNRAYRRVFFTLSKAPGTPFQLAAMSISDTVGWEQHSETVQYFLVKAGQGRKYIGTNKNRAEAETEEISTGSAFFITAGTWHDIENTNQSVPLKLFTVYFPPHHRPATLHLTKADAERTEGLGHPAK